MVITPTASKNAEKPEFSCIDRRLVKGLSNSGKQAISCKTKQATTIQVAIALLGICLRETRN
jgi:hypothetical protein